MGDQLAPSEGNFTGCTHQHCHQWSTSWPTHIIQLPDHMPTDTSDKIPRHVARSCLEMGLDGHEVIGDSTGDGGLHDGREKLGEWTMLVGWPQQ